MEPILKVTTPTLKTKESLWKRGWKDCKSQKIREFSMRSSLLVLTEATPTKSHQHDYLNKVATIVDMLKWMKTMPGDLNPTQRTTDN